MNRDPRSDQKPAQKPGQVKEITALTNPVIKYLRSLNLKKNRDQDKVFLVEGLKLVTDAIDMGWPVKTLIYAKNMSDQPHLQKVAATARARGADILEVSEKVLSAVTRRDNPQMVVGLMGQKWANANGIKPTGSDVWVGLDRVRDPGNLGTIIRTCDAVGARGVILIGDTTDPFAIETVRATMGSIFNVALARLKLDEFEAWRKAWPGMVVGTHLKGAVDYRTIDYSEKPCLLLMGNEQQGLPEGLAHLCDHLALIPQAGKADSLNLAIATGVMLFEVRRDALFLPEGT